MNIIDGKTVKKTMLEELKKKVQKLNENLCLLVIQVGNIIMII